MPYKKHSPFQAAFASWFCPGLGQVYNESLGKGLLFLFGVTVGYFIFIIPGLLLQLYGVYNAYAGEKKIQAGTLPYRKAKGVEYLIYVAALITAIIVTAVIWFIVLFGLWVFVESI